MKWYNLKKNKCPKCGKDISGHYNERTRMFVCPCDFKISAEKFERIVTGMVDQDIEHTDINKESGV